MTTQQNTAAKQQIWHYYTTTFTTNHVIYQSQHLTSSPPDTSTSTAKLVRWVELHRTVVTFPIVMLLMTWIPSELHPPLPTLWNSIYIVVANFWKILTVQKSPRRHQHIYCQNSAKGNKTIECQTEQ